MFDPEVVRQAELVWFRDFRRTIGEPTCLCFRWSCHRCRCRCCLASTTTIDGGHHASQFYWGGASAPPITPHNTNNPHNPQWGTGVWAGGGVGVWGCVGGWGRGGVWAGVWGGCVGAGVLGCGGVMGGVWSPPKPRCFYVHFFGFLGVCGFGCFWG